MGLTAYRAVMALACVAAYAGAACVPSGTEDAINELFRLGGSDTTVELCPGSIHRIQSPIVMTASNQVLTTEGDPKDRMRAMILVEGENQAMAIKADCDECDSVEIRSLIVDGNRPMLLRVPKGDALVELGNAENQVIQDCRLYEPRGWSALHFREGNRKQCRKGKVLRNEIGPAGEEWDVNYDGLVELTPPWGNPRADGISLACKDSLVAHNTVYDCTDGAIVIFGSAGSVVHDNLIYSRSRVILGGINMVDYEPWDGDYTDTHVHHNTIAGLGSYLKVGINVGPATWSDDTDSIVHSGKVTHNTITGDAMGYGIVVASAKGFTVMDNKSTAKYSGVMGERCPRAPPNGEPTAFLINQGSAEGIFQNDFVNGEVQHVICVEPVTNDGEPYQPRRLRDSPSAMAAKAEEDAKLNPPEVNLDNLDAIVAESLVGYQMELMKAMEDVSVKIKAIDEPERGEGQAARAGKSKSPFAKALDDLASRLDNLEAERRSSLTTFDSLKADLRKFNMRIRGHERDQNSLLHTVLSTARALMPSSAVHRRETWPQDAATSAWTPALSFLLVQGAIVILVWAFRCLGRDKLGRRRALSLGRQHKGKIY